MVSGERHVWTAEDHAMVARAMHEATDAIDSAVGAFEEDARELGRRGWTVPVDQLPEFGPVVVRSTSPDETDAIFLLLYEQNGGVVFRQLVDGLLGEPKLARWRPLLAQCVRAYDRGDHLVAVPALLSIFEGALCSVVGRFADRSPRQLAAEELSDASRGLDRVLWASIDAFTQVLFRNSTFGNDRPEAMNRHWVLHGRDETTWLPADALRVFQAIHSVGSATLLQKRDMRLMFSDPELYDRLMSFRKERGVVD